MAGIFILKWIAAFSPILTIHVLIIFKNWSNSRADAALLCQGPVKAIVEHIKFYIDKFARKGQCMIHLNQIPSETPC